MQVRSKVHGAESYPEGVWDWHHDGLQEASELQRQGPHLHGLLVHFLPLCHVVTQVVWQGGEG